jgi:hypothetical protein
MNIQNLSRRDFLKASAALGGSFALGLILDPVTRLHPFYGKYIGLSSADAAEGVTSAAGTFSPNLFVSIDRSGTVTIVAHRSEMGQGSTPTARAACATTSTACASSAPPRAPCWSRPRPFSGA